MVDGNLELQANDEPKTAQKPISFVPEIQQMMYGLGDCSEPLRESAELIEKIVVEQMSLLVSQAREVMQLRGANILAPEDILFLLRRNEPALKRFITYMGVKDEREALNGMLKVIPDVAALNDQQPMDTKLNWKKNRKNYCMKVLNEFGFDRTKISNLVDVLKEERTARACRISLRLSPSAYKEFHAARCSSFASANLSKSNFEVWLKTRIKYKEELTPAMIEIFVYIAKETIACLIDMIMTVREDNNELTSNSTPITISEIREVIRRHTYQQSLPFNAFSRDLPPTIHTRLIAF